MMRSRVAGPAAALAAALLLAGCGGWTASGPSCRPLGEPLLLPEGLEESSGVAVGAADPGVIWTINDSGDDFLWAIDREGGRLGRVRLRRVAHRDWEDLAMGPCAPGGSGADGAGPGGGTGEAGPGRDRCLYVGDVGDNDAVRDTLYVHRLAEPAPDAAPVEPETFPVVLPDGPRDVEAMFVRPDARLWLVGKGGAHPVSVYRSVEPLDAGRVVRMEEVQRLSEEPRLLPRQVTGAAATPDGRVVVLRTYDALQSYRIGDDGLEPIEGSRVSLHTLQEGQGEAVALGPDGEVVLTSEAGPLGSRATMARLRCEPVAGTAPAS